MPNRPVPQLMGFQSFEKTANEGDILTGVVDKHFCCSVLCGRIYPFRWRLHGENRGEQEENSDDGRLICRVPIVHLVQQVESVIPACFTRWFDSAHHRRIRTWTPDKNI